LTDSAVGVLDGCETGAAFAVAARDSIPAVIVVPAAAQASAFRIYLPLDSAYAIGA
jgi:hypothetical protein